jgi:hypothetical protein
MREVIFIANAEGDPSGVRNPVVLFGHTVCQECIAESPWKRYIDDAPGVDVSDFGTLESEFPTSETMWMSRHVRPCGNFTFEPL